MSDPFEWTPEEWAVLEAELLELERADPEVAAAAAKLREIEDRIRRGEL